MEIIRTIQISSANLASTGHRVVFLTNQQGFKEPGAKRVEVHHFTIHRQASKDTHHYLTNTEDAILQGQAVLRSLDELKSKDFIPDFVITHGGMGLGLFIKDYTTQYT